MNSDYKAATHHYDNSRLAVGRNPTTNRATSKWTKTLYKNNFLFYIPRYANKFVGALQTVMKGILIHITPYKN